MRMRRRRGQRALWVLLLALLPAASTQPRTPPGTPRLEPPEVLFQDLFAAVQTAAIFPDGKTFVDAVPNLPPKTILAQYHAANLDSADALKRFVDAHFTLPAPAMSVPSPPERVPIIEHIDGLWSQLTRNTPTAPPYSSALPLPRPYVVPGGRFREIYYWDSYFTMLGLARSGRKDLLVDMVDDFAYLVDTYGHIPNGARTYYLSRSQPPFFFAMVGLLAPDDPANAYAKYLPQLRREYDFWMDGVKSLHRGAARRRVVMMADGSLLNRYWDDRDTPRDESYRDDVEVAHASGRPAAEVYRNLRAAAESGWDFSSRWFEDGATRASIDTTEIVPIDLNSLLFGLESAIRAGCEKRGDTACAADFSRRAAARRSAIDRYLWSGSGGAYFDYRWTRRTAIARLSAATLYPLFFGAASDSQAIAVEATVTAELLEAGGVVTTPVNTGQQWDAPNGWAPLQWIAIAGLRRYGQNGLAETIACRWIVNVVDVYRRSGKLVEKYDVVTTGRSGGGGEYPTQDGFGWTNGVTRELLALYPATAGYTNTQRCPKP
ncbi:MAG TPA: alpha,alpha-trehalase TreF [Steroidobacteraceae bacterium]|nr:alpha,alpha-trehalase TreF [Steroidobacteraceae bacterium]